MPAQKVEVVGTYVGRTRWAIARFPINDEDPRGYYRIGTFVHGGINFNERPFGSREDAEAYLVYTMDDTVRL